MCREHLIAQTGPALLLLAGLGFGLAALLTLDLGSFRRMGPGAFPLLVAGLLTILSVITLVRNLLKPMSRESADLVSVLTVSGGVATFAFLTPIAGVVPGVAISVLVTSLAARRLGWRVRMTLSIGVSMAIWLIFVKGLQIPLSAFGSA